MVTKVIDHGDGGGHPEGAARVDCGQHGEGHRGDHVPPGDQSVPSSQNGGPAQVLFQDDVDQPEFGSNTCPGCSYHPKIGQVLSQAYICMDKELRLIDCKGCEKPCRSSEPVYYRPFHVTAV